MHHGRVTAHERLITKLESIAELSNPAKAALSALPLRFVEVPENADITRQGDDPVECGMIVEGFACRYKILSEGQRQIMSFHMAGDIPDLQSLHLRVMDHSIGALTPVVAAFIPHAALHEIARAVPEVAAVFWRDTLIDAAVFREWLAGVGRRSAHQRIAHLICEVFVRLRSLRLAKSGSFQLPVTQVELADALGLSAVHVNRVLQDLRREGLIDYRGRFVVIEDWPGLEVRGDFDPEYLHLMDPQGPWT